MTDFVSVGANAIFGHPAEYEAIVPQALQAGRDAVSGVQPPWEGTITAGTRVATLRGALRAHDLRAGDRVLTRDNGYQPIAHLHRHNLSTAQLLARQDLWPVRIAPKVIDGLMPDRPLLVAATLHLLVCTPRAQTLFGQTEVLIPVSHLTDRPGVRRILPKAGAQLVTLGFKRPEIFVADGVWSASASDATGQDEGRGAAPARMVLDPDQSRRLLG